MSWYVVQVRSGHEAAIASRCRTMISEDILTECFIPECRFKKRYRGGWHDVRDVLFKGYVFMISDRITELYTELKKVPDFIKVLGKKETEIYPLDEDEVVFIKSFGKEDHIIEMSYGFIEGDRIHITEGPLQGKEGLIVKIDRHKRIAYLQLNMFDKEITTKVGLEIISKCQ